MRTAPDLTGETFGRLIVIGRFESEEPQHDSEWVCVCSCGKVTIKTRSNLKSDHSQSCGCLKSEKATTHGKRKTRLYRIWLGMRDRCTNVTSPNFQNYGGRGISVCAEWDDFQTFYQWAMANGYKPALTIDRLDVNGNYCPQNTRWATSIEQNRNRRNNHLLTYAGKTMPISQWADETGLNQSTILRRVNFLGWSAEQALTTPPKG